MNSECDICKFLSRKPLKNQILTTEHWTVGIIPDQYYLGRALITLLDHKPSLGMLNENEWSEFQLIVTKLEKAYKELFNAEPLNLGCFMNHSYRDTPPHPHVHWQVFPRYKETQEFMGLDFIDSRYGSFYDDDAHNLVTEEIVAEIAKRLTAVLN
jgi:diadenosine tetraphosphate (Ap4A) HIT family hydrolase